MSDLVIHVHLYNLDELGNYSFRLARIHRSEMLCLVVLLSFASIFFNDLLLGFVDDVDLRNHLIKLRHKAHLILGFIGAEVDIKQVVEVT